jgi:hypothetical protein
VTSLRAYAGVFILARFCAVASKRFESPAYTDLRCAQALSMKDASVTKNKRRRSHFPVSTIEGGGFKNAFGLCPIPPKASGEKDFDVCALHPQAAASRTAGAFEFPQGVYDDAPREGLIIGYAACDHHALGGIKLADVYA